MEKLIKILGFKPKDNELNIYTKQYANHGNYSIEIDFNTEHINYGDLINFDHSSTQNFSMPENCVVLECVNRLLEKGYPPECIVLEKTWPSGHGTSGRLDILVNKPNGEPFILIECKTYGKEYNKELKNIRKNGGQLFTYFQLCGCKADFLMLYASQVKNDEIIFCNDIIKIEEEYRHGDIADIYEKWNKLTKDNGIFNEDVNVYNFKSKAITLKDLKPITQEDSSFIFNRFLEILRHNVVSDKGNAFNKIFTLFLCKVYDETNTKQNEELKFQWLEGEDDVTFQLRLTKLYSQGMRRFLDRTVSDFDEDDFQKRFSTTIKPGTAEYKYIVDEVNKVRLQKNNEFAIKEVYDKLSFKENAKVVREVVELLQNYRIRYNKRQQYLSDFFELLLTTGLKQESGQFFTPVPIAQFIIKSLPIDKIVTEQLEKENGKFLPFMIDYASGSGHFITEYMHEIQAIIDNIDENEYSDDKKQNLLSWKTSHFNWATDYVYGIEKDYRLVKVGKVGCYLHGDGLANVILSDGLASFHCNQYKGILRKEKEDNTKDNQQFDILLSNPPYSVSAFRQTTRDYYTEKDFDLYSALTDNSSEIECLFVERAKQLLKEGGYAGIILPSSILSNTGIYTKTREVILKFFDIVGITELGSNTFMATGTNTVVLFLRRRDNYYADNTKYCVDEFFKKYVDVTINGIEYPVTKYVTDVWQNISLDGYITLLKRQPNDAIKNHDIYQDYAKNINAKDEEKLLDIIIETEKEKIWYYLLAYKQDLVIVKSGEKDNEKRFLGYEFSNRRGNEGIHAIQKGKSVTECTKLFDEHSFINPTKASTYIYNSFLKNLNLEIPEELKDHIFYSSLKDILTFDRWKFDKTISTAIKKKVNFNSIWSYLNLVPLGDLTNIEKGKSITKAKTTAGNIPVIAGGKGIAYYHNQANRNGNVITISASGAYSGYVSYYNKPIFASDCNTVISKDEEIISTYFIYILLSYIQDSVLYKLQRGQAQPHVYAEDLKKIQIPLPPKEIQQQIVDEISEIEKQVSLAKERISKLENTIEQYFETSYNNSSNIIRLSDSKVFNVSIGKRVLSYDIKKSGTPVYSANVYIPFGYTDMILISDFSEPSVIWGIDGNWQVAYIKNGTPFYPTDHCGVLRVIDKSVILPLYLKYALYKEGLQLGFSRNYRASIDRIKSISVRIPSIEEQTRIVSEIEKYEKEISQLREIISQFTKRKEGVLNKYLK